MPLFSTVLVSGAKRPYNTWTFVVVPDRIITSFGSKRVQVKGTINNVEFRGTVSKGEGVYRMPVTQDFQSQAGVSCGDKVQVFMEVDPEPRPVEVPHELQRVLDDDRELAGQFENLPPAHRRAWASYVSDAKQAETRIRRAAKSIAGIRNKAFP